MHSGTRQGADAHSSEACGKSQAAEGRDEPIVRYGSCGRLALSTRNRFHGLYGWLLPAHPSPANRGGVIFLLPPLAAK